VADSSSLVALRDRREAAIQQLADSFAADLLTMDQFDERVARAHAAATLAELDALVADLPPPAGAKSTALVPLSVEPSLKEPPKRFRAWFGNLERHGAWVVLAELTVSPVFGSSVLDFREARFAAKTITLHATVIFGALEVIVPPQLAVECEGTSIFASIESHGGAIADPDRPLLRIIGTALFGNIEVSTRLPGESASDARRRRRQERKALSAARRAALPPRSE